MFAETFDLAVQTAKKKVAFLHKKPGGYFLSSMLAGMYVGLGIFLIYTIGGYLAGQPYVKLLMGVCFGIALSLVMMAGSELFTGNNLMMMAGMMRGAVAPGAAVKLWVVCYLGNWAGSIVVALLAYGAGIATGPVGEFIAATAVTKMSIPLVSLFLRGVLCNILVCLSVWCTLRLTSDSGKLIMIFWCLFAFITTGYEHSIANMSLLTLSLLSPMGADVSLSGYFYNILVVTLGNMVGGICFVALPYGLISKED